MNQELHILILDDVRTDAELMVFELTEAGLTFTSQYASDKASFLRALEDQQPDIILSDYSLPSFNGLLALEIAQKRYPEIPFIFVSGALGEETAVELLKHGATDYILKDRLARLAPAVSRTIQQVEERAERRRTREALKDSELRYRTIFENTGTATIIIEEDMTIVLANKQFEELTGFLRADIEGRKKWDEFVHQDDLAKTKGFAGKKGLLLEPSFNSCELRIINLHGDILHVLAGIAAIPSTNRKILSLLDITRLRKVEKEKREASLYARSLIEASLDPLVTISSDGKIMDVNEATRAATGLSREMLIGSDFENHFTEPARARVGYLEVVEKGIIRDYHLSIRHVSGRVTDVLFNATPYRNETGDIQGIFGAARDITERLKAEKRILANNEMLRTLSSELVMTEERERRRIAVDLHDNIGQTLAMIKIKLNAMREQAATNGLKGPMSEVLEMVEQSIEQTRSLTRELSPSVLYELGLNEALKWLGDQMLSQHGFNVILKNNLKSGKIDKDVQIFIYRSLRELIFNIIKHAKVKEAEIMLQKSGENILMTVKDEGCGFDISTVDQIFKKSGCFGLLSIRERLNYLGGCLEIETKKGWGTKVEMIVPPKKRRMRK